jgi:mannose-6-phosphate isomerase-like protein (cupin superfamily)
MSETNRREFGVGLAALAAAARAQTAAEAGSFGAARVIVPELTRAANGAERWAGPAGSVATGEAISMHESVVPAGTPKGTLHVIHHSELIVILEGTVSFQHGEVVETAHAGSILYVAYGTNHLVWNSGETAARYVVLQVGGDTKKA